MEFTGDMSVHQILCTREDYEKHSSVFMCRLKTKQIRPWFL